MAVVVSHIASSFEALAAQALRQVPLSDVIELRLDRIGNPGEERLRGLLRELKKPAIVAVRNREERGDFAGSVDEQLDILRTAARAGAMFVVCGVALWMGGRLERILAAATILAWVASALAEIEDKVGALMDKGYYGTTLAGAALFLMLAVVAAAAVGKRTVAR